MPLLQHRNILPVANEGEGNYATIANKLSFANFSTAAELLVTARRRAGLSQRELAERAKTSQSVVARIELGAASPSWDTLARLLAAAGFELDVRLSLRPVSGSHMLDDVARILRLTPAERLAEVANLSRLPAAATRDHDTSIVPTDAQ